MWPSPLQRQTYVWEEKRARRSLILLLLLLLLPLLRLHSLAAILPRSPLLRRIITHRPLHQSQFGHASFVNAAIDRLEELGEKGDLALYNDILAVFPERNT